MENGGISLLRSINIRLDTSLIRRSTLKFFCYFLFLEREQLFIAFMENIPYSLVKRVTDVLSLSLKNIYGD